MGSSSVRNRYPNGYYFHFPSITYYFINYVFFSVFSVLGQRAFPHTAPAFSVIFPQLFASRGFVHRIGQNPVPCYWRWQIYLCPFPGVVCESGTWVGVCLDFDFFAEPASVVTFPVFFSRYTLFPGRCH